MMTDPHAKPDADEAATAGGIRTAVSLIPRLRGIRMRGCVGGGPARQAGTTASQAVSGGQSAGGLKGGGYHPTI